jgi:hypothetical protein
MLNNMVSPIDHVIMNPQNQTRTNGTWGHVRYTISQANRVKGVAPKVQVQHVERWQACEYPKLSSANYGM